MASREKDLPFFAVILMSGLQGAGKTTSAAKLALRLKNKNGKKVLNAGKIALNSGGRPVKKKDQRNNPLQTNSVTVE